MITRPKKEEKEVKKKVLLIPLALLLAISLVAIGCPAPEEPPPPPPPPTDGGPPPPPPAPEKITIGRVLSLTGADGPATAHLETPNQELWLADLEEKGGIFVPQYNKNIPVEMIVYDCRSDIQEAVQLTKKLVYEDKVDLLWTPYSTSHHLATADIANENKMPWVGMTCGSEIFKEQLGKYPYTFIIINSPSQKGEALSEMFKDLGVETVAIAYVAGEYGIDQASIQGAKMEFAGLEIVMRDSYPLGPEDLTALIRKAKGLNPDAFVTYSYPPDTLLMTQQAIIENYNPDVFFVDLAAAWPLFLGIYGKQTEGVMSTGGWNENIPAPKAKPFYDRFLAMHGEPPDNWSVPYGFAALEVLEQAINRVGYEDRDALRDAIATGEFDTVIGTVRFELQYNVLHPSQIGQWQNLKFEAIAPAETATAEPIYPKPPWPAEK